MLIKILVIIAGTILAGILGRMGGSDKYGTIWRDIGVPLVACIVIGVIAGFHWTLIVCFGALYGAMTTYFKKKGEPVRFYNWLICGLAYSVAFVPYVWSQGLWTGFGIRSLVLPIAVMAWCSLIGNAVVEELGRYALIVLTIPLLFIKRKKKET